MSIEIQRPELERRMLRQIQSGRYRDIEELLTDALDALDRKEMQSSPEMQSEELRDERTGADLIAALRASPYRELEIEPPRYREAIPVRDVRL